MCTVRQRSVAGSEAPSYAIRWTESTARHPLTAGDRHDPPPGSPNGHPRRPDCHDRVKTIPPRGLPDGGPWWSKRGHEHPPRLSKKERSVSSPCVIPPRKASRGYSGALRAAGLGAVLDKHARCVAGHGPVSRGHSGQFRPPHRGNLRRHLLWLQGAADRG